jgi:hypothetical protein
MEETRELMELCSVYHLKWVIIQDRFSANKTLEELKARYDPFFDLLDIIK